MPTDDTQAIAARLKAALVEVELHCPCGARPESSRTHPHVIGCPVAAAFYAAYDLSAHVETLTQQVATAEEAVRDYWQPRLDEAEQQRDAAHAAEQRLRMLLWLRHGCPSHSLYGDDGEMQCNNLGCRIDFKRWSVENIERRWRTVGEQALIDAALAASAPQKEEAQPLESPSEPHCGNCCGTEFEIVPVEDGGEEVRCLTCGETERLGKPAPAQETER